MRLEAHGLRSGYGSVPVLHGVSFDIGSGEVVAVVGRNGAGKTTLVKTVAGVLRATGGGLMLDGAEITRLPPSGRVRAGLRAAFQERSLFGQLSVGDNLRLNGFPAEQHEAVLALFGESLAGRAAQRAGTLSGGEQKMLTAALVLSSSASLLIMDEPTEGLQPSNVELLGDALHSAKESGRSVLLVEQHLSLAMRLADRFIVLSKGEVVDAGTAGDAELAGRLVQHLAI
ncbi:ATP-binding cassette domain-containing protein [Candidatus Poriferisodalis sp.]|uniref:ATP-binding cassette domain-containing protein n=1 Tax=Candidatus Poriferisodalis sp. TaxID=3101277 RepID=UPI003B018F62